MSRYWSHDRTAQSHSSVGKSARESQPQGGVAPEVRGGGAVRSRRLRFSVPRLVAVLAETHTWEAGSVLSSGRCGSGRGVGISWTRRFLGPNGPERPRPRMGRELQIPACRAPPRMHLFRRGRRARRLLSGKRVTLGRGTVSGPGRLCGLPLLCAGVLGRVPARGGPSRAGEAVSRQAPVRRAVF